MSKTFQKSLAVLLCAVLLYGAVPLYGFVGLKALAVNDPTFGSCGDHLNWEFDGDNCTLTITGTGEMYDYRIENDNAYHPEYLEYDYDRYPEWPGYAFDPDHDSIALPPWEPYTAMIESVVISNGVTGIGDFAFFNCYNLTTVSIPDGIVSIGCWSFADCYNLFFDNLPDSITSIGYHAFYGTANYNASWTWSEHALYIGHHLIAVTDPNMPHDPGSQMPNDFEIERGTKCIAAGAFYNCDELWSVSIPNGVTGIGDFAFFICRNLTDVVIPDSVERIGYRAFFHCDSLAEVTVSSTTRIDCGAFKGCDSLSKVYYRGTQEDWNQAEHNGYIGYDNQPLTDPSTTVNYLGHSVDSGVCGKTLSWSFDANTSTLTISGTGEMYDYDSDDAPWYNAYPLIEDVVIESGVTSIGSYAFCNCENLSGVTVAASVTSIGAYAFGISTSIKDIYYAGSQAQWNAITIAEGNDSFEVTIHSAADMLDFGSCGRQLVWTYEESTFTLTISGSGAMSNYFSNSPAPWYAFRQTLKTVVIGNDVTSIGDYAFYQIKGMTNVTIGSSVTTVGEYAFYNCTGLTGVVIPDSVISIDHYAFDYCSGLTSLSLGSSLRFIGYYAFHFCTGLTSVVIPNSVTRICNYAFCNCENLANVTVGDHVATIDFKAFGNCSALNEITLPDSVTSVGARAFEECTSLTSASIGNGLTEISDYMFYDCTALTEVTFGSSVTSIGDYAFYRTKLTSVNIPDSVTNIEANAFSQCQELTSFTVGSGLASIHSNFLNKVYTFGACPNLKSITVSTDNPNFSSDEFGVLYNKDKTELLQYPIGRENTSFAIPNTVTRIGNYSFSYAGKLTSITIPGSVTQIGEYAFYHTGLTRVTVPNSVTTIDSYVFSGCTNLTDVTIPDSVVSIGSGIVESTAYSANSDNWQNDVLYVGNHLIKAKSTVSGAYAIRPGTKCIGGFAFNGLAGLTAVAIPDSVVSIGIYAFYNCTGLTGVSIPNGVVSIGEDAFYGCSNLANVSIADSVREIGYHVFFLTAYYDDDSNWQNEALYIGNHLIKAKSTVSGNYEINPGTVCVAQDAFYGNNNLTGVTVPVSVVSINKSAFSNCTGLSDVNYTGSQEQWNAIMIGSDNDPLLNAALHAVAPHVHAYTFTVTKDPTCTEEGVCTYTCECGDTYTESMAKLPHTTKTVTIPATCTETGLQYEVCELCGERLSEDVVIPAKGHTCSEWRMVINPTVTSTGKMCRFCTECGMVMDEMMVPNLIDDRVSGIELSSSREYVYPGDTLTLTAAVTPETALNKTVLWTSSDPDVAAVENGVVTAIAPGMTVIIAQTADCGYKDFCVVQVNAVTPQNGSVIDTDNGVIYGLSVNLNSLDEYLNLDDETMTIEYSTDVIGTGTKIVVKQGDTVVNEFEAVIFGDVSGDSWYNGTDAYFVQLVANGMLSSSALTEAQRMAADCNHDGSIDSTDVALLEQAGLLLTQVDQNLTSDELQTNSVYPEYCGLIDQSAEHNDLSYDEPQQLTQTETSFWQLILDLFNRLVNFFTMIFSIIVIPK